MENMSPRISIYQQRDFGAKVTATFQFIRENWKPLLKYVTAFTLPVSIVQSFCMNMYIQSGALDLVGTVDTSAGSLVAVGIYYALTMLCSVVGALVLYSLFYAMLAAYDRREERLRGITWKELSPDFFHFLRRGFALVLFTMLIVFAYVAVTVILVVATPATLIVTLPVLFVCMIPLALFYPAYMLDDKSSGIVAAFYWSMRNGFRFWGSTFLVVFVCYLLASIAGGVCSVPWYIIYIFNLITAMPESGLDSMQGSTLLSVLQFLFGIIMLCGTYLASVVVLLGLTYQYGHIREKVDAVTVDKDIENFDRL